MHLRQQLEASCSTTSVRSTIEIPAITPCYRSSIGTIPSQSNLAQAYSTAFCLIMSYLLADRKSSLGHIQSPLQIKQLGYIDLTFLIVFPDVVTPLEPKNGFVTLVCRLSIVFLTS